MLLIIDNIKEMNEKITIDPYIPLEVQWGDEALQYSYKNYWRTGDLERSFFEIGIDSRNGGVRSLTLILAGDDIFFNGNQKIDTSNYRSSSGLPVFDIENWPVSGIKDEANDFKLYLSGNSLQLLFLEHQQTDVILTSGRVRFLVSTEGELIGIQIVQLSNEELGQLEAALKKS